MASMRPEDVPEDLVKLALAAAHPQVPEQLHKELPFFERRVREALAAVLPAQERHVRHLIAGELLGFGSRYYPTHAAMNQTMDQAAAIALDGLYVYDQDNPPRHNTPAAVENAMTQWRQNDERRDALVKAADAVDISMRRIANLMGLARNTVARILGR